MTPLDPRVESLLRSTPRVDVPEGLRTRLLAAHARGERAVGARRPSLAWVSGLAGAAVLVAAVPFLGGDGARPPREVLATAGGLRIRVVDDPSLGLHSDAALPGEGLFADGVEGP